MREQGDAAQKPPAPISVFCAAAPLDAEFLARWEIHLLPLQQTRHITVWSEQHLMAGTPRTQQLYERLDHAQVVLFLFSAEFFASDECMELMEQALASKARVIPLLVRPIDWKTSALANLTCLPSNGLFVRNPSCSNRCGMITCNEW